MSSGIRENKYRFGRRCTIMLHILTSLLGVVFLGAVRLEKFDVCIMKDISNGSQLYSPNLMLKIQMLEKCLPVSGPSSWSIVRVS